MKHLSIETHKSGFTLIEIIIVLAILAVLSSIAVPKFSDYTQQVFTP